MYSFVCVFVCAFVIICYCLHGYIVYVWAHNHVYMLVFSVYVYLCMCVCVCVCATGSGGHAAFGRARPGGREAGTGGTEAVPVQLNEWIPHWPGMPWTALSDPRALWWHWRWAAQGAGLSGPFQHQLHSTAHCSELTEAASFLCYAEVIALGWLQAPLLCVKTKSLWWRKVPVSCVKPNSISVLS